jgi:hypothetical protein
MERKKRRGAAFIENVTLLATHGIGEVGRVEDGVGFVGRGFEEEIYGP